MAEAASFFEARETTRLIRWLRLRVAFADFRVESPD